MSAREAFVDFIIARDRVRRRKEAGLPKPWTDDPILQNYRFCNVHREDDRVTHWIAENWRRPMRREQNMWFWMLVARHINRVSTLELLTQMELVSPVRFYRRAVADLLHGEVASGHRVWGAAYMISTHGVAKNKIDYIMHDVLGSAWARRKEVQPRVGDTLAAFCARLVQLRDISTFLAGQVIADAKYADPHLRNAEDWSTFAVSGPGSRRGLNRVLGRPVNASWREEDWFAELTALREYTCVQLERAGHESLHGQDVQNCLCEFDKYERVRLHEGRPKQRYPGGAEK